MEKSNDRKWVIKFTTFWIIVLCASWIVFWSTSFGQEGVSWSDVLHIAAVVGIVISTIFVAICAIASATETGFPNTVWNALEPGWYSVLGADSQGALLLSKGRVYRVPLNEFDDSGIFKELSALSFATRINSTGKRKLFAVEETDKPAEAKSGQEAPQTA